MEVSICKDLDISHDEFVLVNNVLTEYNDMKEDIKHPQTINPDNV